MAEPEQTPSSRRNIAAAIGPGLIFAGSSVGVSHLVQSTRAGVGWGMALGLFILLALVCKYPSFRFGSLYAAATGKSLLEGYRRLGPWTLWLFAGLTLATMFAIQAAVTMVTAPLMHAELVAVGVGSPGIAWLNALLLGAGAAMLFLGGYAWLDRLTKVLVPVFTVLTIIAAALVLPVADFAAMTWWPTEISWEAAGTVAFVAALIGWMPTAIDIAAWQSLWVLARGRSTGRRPVVAHVLLDFNIGYVGTGVLAFCFLLLGASAGGGDVVFPDKATAFPGFFIDLYRSSVGAWAGGLVSIAALAVMLSTTISVLDGFPRVISVLVQRFRTAESTDGFVDPPASSSRGTGEGLYRWCIVGLASGALVLLQALSHAFLTVIDVATIASFLTAPVLAWMNHRVMTRTAVPAEHRLSRGMLIWSWASIVTLSSFGLFYVALRVMDMIG